MGPQAGPELSRADRDALDGGRGDAVRLAMRIVVAWARAQGARGLLDVTSAHVDGCLYHGRVSLDFARRLRDAGASVRVPTTLNVGAVDLLHPERFRGDPSLARAGRELMELYVSMGCRPTFTCAPYQLVRPAVGEHVAWAESNAIVFANSVLGARTDRYGDFVDICAAVTGRAPDSGLHLTERRRGQVLFRLRGVPDRLLDDDALYPVLGLLVGARAGVRVPVIVGLPPGTGEDRLKALGAGAASSGGVALFHAVGVTPEAPTARDAFQGSAPEEEVDVTMSDLRRARDSLSTAPDGRLDAVSVGAPHLSVPELEALARLLGDLEVHPAVELYVNTGRDVLEAAPGAARELERAGARVVVDTCTYITPILRAGPGRVVMMSSAKAAYYAPGNLGLGVVFGSVVECVRSAALGKVWRDPGLWAG